ncbi:hypothetical protein H0H81_003922 [Sphagnurus paluster]|uniref:J domain-containing protein n=1 Tax=Sphagnurus paluster TaxID=117069 RepID=A0A9P7KLH4_9AGAR|nr:hypothetical protein H0H81_003922 [Sphagnurus paluster]
MHCRSLTPSERHARFQSITKAYDILRGKASPFSGNDPYREEVLRRKHYYQAYHNRQAEYMRQHMRSHAARPDWNASADDRWKDRVILLVGILTLAAGLAPGLFMLPFHMEKQHQSAVSNLRQARHEARELGEERRNELRKRVKDIRKMQSGLASPCSEDET